MEPQNTSNSQRNLEKEQSERFYAPRFPTMLQSYNNQKKMGIGMKSDIEIKI